MIIITSGAAGEDWPLQQLGAGDTLEVVTPLVPLQHGQGGGGGEEGGRKGEMTGGRGQSGAPQTRRGTLHEIR